MVLTCPAYWFFATPVTTRSTRRMAGAVVSRVTEGSFADTQESLRAVTVKPGSPICAWAGLPTTPVTTGGTVPMTFHLATRLFFP